MSHLRLSLFCIALLASVTCIRQAPEGEGGDSVDVPARPSQEQVTVTDHGPTTWTQDHGDDEEEGGDSEGGDSEGGGDTADWPTEEDTGWEGGDSESEGPSDPDWAVFAEAYLELFCDMLENECGSQLSCEDLGFDESLLGDCPDDGFQQDAALDCLDIDEWSCETAWPSPPTACYEVCLTWE